MVYYLCFIFSSFTTAFEKSFEKCRMSVGITCNEENVSENSDCVLNKNPYQFSLQLISNHLNKICFQFNGLHSIRWVFQALQILYCDPISITCTSWVFYKLLSTITRPMFPWYGNQSVNLQSKLFLCDLTTVRKLVYEQFNPNIKDVFVAGWMLLCKYTVCLVFVFVLCGQIVSLDVILLSYFPFRIKKSNMVSNRCHRTL